MKRLFIIFSLISMSIILFLTPKEANANCETSCSSTWSDFITEALELPGYSGCSVTFTYRERQCIVLGQKITEFDIRKFRVYTNGTDSCKKLYDKIITDPTPDWDFTDWIFKQGFTELSIEYFMALYNAAKPGDKWQFECSEIYMKYEASWRSCAQFVVYLEQKPGSWDLYIEIDPCEDLICCLHTLEMCWDTEEDELYINENYSYDNGECEAEPEEHEGAAWESDCLPICIEP